MKTIKGFEGEEIAVSGFGEWVGKDYIDYKFEYKNNQKVIKELFKENQELKKQLEEYELSLKISKEMLDLQGQDGNYNYDSYMLGVYNGMEYIIALFEKREPIYKDGKDIDFLEDKNKNQQKEFIEYLEKEIVDSSAGSGQQYYAQQHLRLYKEIIGDKK